MEDKQTKKQNRKNGWREELKENAKQMGRNFAFMAFVLICVILSYCFWTYLIGISDRTDYEGTYESIEEAIDVCLSEAGIDNRNLQTLVEEYDEKYANGSTTLTCGSKNGYFTPRVTVTLSNTFEIVSHSRNYTWYHVLMGILTIVGAIGLFAAMQIIECIFNVIRMTVKKKEPQQVEAENEEQKPIHEIQSVQAIRSAREG